MNRITDETLGVCSWSLGPTGPGDLAEKVAACGLKRVQLALDPIRRGEWDARETADALAGIGAKVCSGMMAPEGEDYSTLETIARTGGVRPDAAWEANREAARANAALAQELGIGLVTMHAGFLPHETGDAERTKMVGRLAAVADTLADRGVRLGLETGQEPAGVLIGVLEELGRPGWVGVNFDPANMVLYRSGYPLEALRLLAPWVMQVHVKDAILSAREGEWGEEVVVGEGRVDWEGLFGVVAETGIDCGFVIEREAGDDRVQDVRRARSIVGPLLSAVLAARG